MIYKMHYIILCYTNPSEITAPTSYYLIYNTSVSLKQLNKYLSFSPKHCWSYLFKK